MNLKIIKGNYLASKQNLNYDLFGEYMKIVGKKKLFKGGFGNTNLQLGNIKTKVKHNPVESLDHKYQIYTIIKRYNETIRKRPIENINTKERKSRNSLIRRKASMIKARSSLILLNSNYIGKINTATPGSTNVMRQSNSTTYFHKIPSMSAGKDISYSLKDSQKFRKTNTNTTSTNYMRSTLPFLRLSASNMTKKFKDPFINPNEEINASDKHLLRKRLANNYKFYQMDKITDKYQLNRNKSTENKHELLKHSLLRINEMRRKDINNSNCSSNNNCSSL